MRNIKMALFTLTLGSAFLWSCSGKKKEAASPDVESVMVSDKKENKNDKHKVQPIIVDQQASISKSDNYNLWSAEIDDGYLKAVVNYSGGCRDHEFIMYSNGMWAKSMPPQVNLFLVHNSNEDFCKAFIYDTLYYDLTNVINPQSNAVVLKINTPAGKVENLTFEYEAVKK